MAFIKSTLAILLLDIRIMEVACHDGVMSGHVSSSLEYDISYCGDINLPVTFPTNCSVMKVHL